MVVSSSEKRGMITLTLTEAEARGLEKCATQGLSLVQGRDWMLAYRSIFMLRRFLGIDRSASATDG